MRMHLCGAALLVAVAAPAKTETLYDRNLEEAAMKIVAGKMGDIRGGFSYRQAPQFVVVPDKMASPIVEGPRKEAVGEPAGGLKPAIERPASRTIF